MSKKPRNCWKIGFEVGQKTMTAGTYWWFVLVQILWFFQSRMFCVDFSLLLFQLFCENKNLKFMESCFGVDAVLGSSRAFCGTFASVYQLPPNINQTNTNPFPLLTLYTATPPPSESLGIKWLDLCVQIQFLVASQQKGFIRASHAPTFCWSCASLGFPQSKIGSRQIALLHQCPKLTRSN